MTLFDIVGACLGVGLLIASIAIAILQEKEKQERCEREVKGNSDAESQ